MAESKGNARGQGLAKGGKLDTQERSAGKGAGAKNPQQPQETEEFRDLENPMNDFPGRPPKDSTWSP